MSAHAIVILAENGVVDPYLQSIVAQMFPLKKEVRSAYMIPQTGQNAAFVHNAEAIFTID